MLPYPESLWARVFNNSQLAPRPPCEKCDLVLAEIGTVGEHTKEICTGECLKK
jgi:hypothetical protein